MLCNVKGYFSSATRIKFIVTVSHHQKQLSRQPSEAILEATSEATFEATSGATFAAISEATVEATIDATVETTSESTVVSKSYAALKSFSYAIRFSRTDHSICIAISVSLKLPAHGFVMYLDRQQV